MFEGAEELARTLANEVSPLTWLGFVAAEIAGVGTKSITINNQINRPDGIVAARGVVIMVAWDREGRCSRPVSAAERAAYGG